MKHLALYFCLTFIIMSVANYTITALIMPKITVKPIILVAPCDVAPQPEDTMPPPPMFNTTKHQVKILEEVTCKDGTSIVFKQDGREWGLDFLTPHELDSLKAL